MTAALVCRFLLAPKVFKFNSIRSSSEDILVLYLYAAELLTVTRLLLSLVFKIGV